MAVRIFVKKMYADEFADANDHLPYGVGVAICKCDAKAFPWLKRQCPSDSWGIGKYFSALRRVNVMPRFSGTNTTPCISRRASLLKERDRAIGEWIIDAMS